MVYKWTKHMKNGTENHVWWINVINNAAIDFYFVFNNQEWLIICLNINSKSRNFLKALYKVPVAPKHWFLHASALGKAAENDFPWSTPRTKNPHRSTQCLYVRWVFHTFPEREMCVFRESSNRRYTTYKLRGKTPRDNGLINHSITGTPDDI